MPLRAKPQPSGSGSKKKKKKSFWDRIPGSKIVANTAKDVEEIARGAPGGVAFTTRAIDKALPRGPLERGKRKHGDYEDLKTLGKAQIQAIRDLRHPLRHPGYSLLTLLGLGVPATRGVGAGLSVAKTGKLASRAGKYRKLSYKPRNEGEVAEFAKALGIEPQKLKGAKEFHAPNVPQSRIPTTALAQKGGDVLRSKSRRLQKRKVLSEIARDKEIAARLDQGNPLGFKGALKEAKSKKTFQKINPATLDAKDFSKALLELGVREPNALIRALRLYRLAYIPPNWLGAQAVNMIHSGPRGYMRQVKTQRKGRRSDPETAQMIDRLGGETLSEASFDAGSGPIGTVTRGIGTSLGKVTDRASRNRIWREEARRHGYSDKELAALLRAAKSGNQKALQDVVRITRRQEPAAIRFTRTGPPAGKRMSVPQGIDKVLADNLFLYKWLTGSARYGGRSLAENPTLIAELAALGKEGPDITELIPEVPEFMENYVGRGVDKLPLVNNPAAASLYDYPFDVLRTLKHSVEDPREIADVLQPVQAALLNAYNAFDPFRDQELEDPPLGERLKFGAATQTRSIPWLEWLRLDDSPEERSKRLFPLTPEDIILRQIVGSSLHPRGFPVNPDVARSMSRKEKSKGKPPKRRKRRSAGY